MITKNQKQIGIVPNAGKRLTKLLNYPILSLITNLILPIEWQKTFF